MNSPDEIRKLAQLRLEEAIILNEAGKCDGAYYLAGYSVELMLKAKICEHIGVPNLLDEDGSNSNPISGIGEIRKLVKTHNLFTLLLLSGLKVKFDQEKAKNSKMAKANSLLFTKWDENARYKPSGHMKPEDVKTLLDLLSEKNGLLEWIAQN